VNKQYKAYFEKSDAVNGWYEIPVVPVQSTPALVVTVIGTAVTYESLGQTRMRIKPSPVWSTITGGSTDTWYMEVTFNAGATNEIANDILKSIVDTMFNNRDSGDTNVPSGRLPYMTLKMIENIDQTTGF
jgi:hypothetical protein